MSGIAAPGRDGHNNQKVLIQLERPDPPRGRADPCLHHQAGEQEEPGRRTGMLQTSGSYMATKI